MITLEKIRNDFKDIRVYYAQKELFNKSSDIVGVNSVIEKVRKYNDAIRTAPPRLYDVYVSLYVNGFTQESLARDRGYSSKVIYLLNKKLIEFLLDNLK